MITYAAQTGEEIEFHEVARNGFETLITITKAYPNTSEYPGAQAKLAEIEANGVAEFQPCPVPLSGTAPHDINLAQWPDGTMMRVTNEAGQSLDYIDATEPLTLTDQGIYTISIAPPLPYHVTSVELEIL